MENQPKNKKPRNNYFFMRHAEAENNYKGLVSSWPEVKNFKLTKKGKEQVKKAVLKIKKEIQKENDKSGRVGRSGSIDIVLSSDLQRTKETAEAMAKALGVKRIIFDSRLREVDFGNFNGMSAAKYHAFFKSKKDRFNNAPDGGESWNDVKKRIFEFLRRIDEMMEYKNILIVSHGDPLWLLEGSAKNLNDNQQLKLKYPKTGEVWSVEYMVESLKLKT